MQNKIIGSCMRLCPPVANEINRLIAENERLRGELLKLRELKHKSLCETETYIKE